MRMTEIYGECNKLETEIMGNKKITEYLCN